MTAFKVIFFIAAALTVSSATMMILSRNPVRSALYLVFTFVTSAVLWILLQAEFLGLILILVYVGAVMTLFLFVVMMLNIQVAEEKSTYVKYLPLGVLCLATIVGLLVYVIAPSHFALESARAMTTQLDYSSIKALGSVLYTTYVYPFELAAVLLFVAIIAAITLSFRGRQNSLAQTPYDQITTRRDDCVRIVKMDTEARIGEAE